MAQTACGPTISEAFSDQEMALIAVQAADGGPLFRPHVLEAIDRVCAAFENVTTDDQIAIKCLTTVPIMEARPTGAQVVVAREAFPLSAAEALHFHALLLQLEFAPGDVIDRLTGTTVSYIHLPRASLEEVDIGLLFDQQVQAETGTLEMALDDGERPIQPYIDLALDGPSSSSLLGLYDAGEDGALKEPRHLLALERFQGLAEAHPKVVQSFTIVDDIKMVRRGLHKGLPAEAYIPAKRAEVAQLLLALSLAPAGNLFGARLDSNERIGLLRLNLSAMSPEERDRIGRRLDAALSRSVEPEATAFLCLED